MAEELKVHKRREGSSPSGYVTTKGLMMSDRKHSGSKYLRSVHLVDGKIDVYAVLEAFSVTCPARQHAIKKLLCAGIRGKGDELQDLEESQDAVSRAIQMQMAKAGTWQYYYKDDACQARHPGNDDCVCWHNIGQGPRPDTEINCDGLEWRLK